MSAALMAVTWSPGWIPSCTPFDPTVTVPPNGLGAARSRVVGHAMQVERLYLDNHGLLFAEHRSRRYRSFRTA
jgi:hypothetical protein